MEVGNYFFRIPTDKLQYRKLGFTLLDNLDVFGNEGEDFVENDLTKLFVRHFATAEDNHNLDTVSVFEETLDFADFDIKVVVADFETDFHRFELRLFFAGFLRFLASSFIFWYWYLPQSMTLTTGGLALAAISTRSTPCSLAIIQASRLDMMPSCSPLAPITRTEG